MRIFKLLMLGFVCFSLIFAGVANAAMPCCWNKSVPIKKVAPEAMGDMPCHKNIKPDSKKTDDMKSGNCCCKYFSKINSNSLYSPVINHDSAKVEDTFVVRFNSVSPEALSPPPKLIS